jgi:hypothetical protein
VRLLFIFCGNGKRARDFEQIRPDIKKDTGGSSMKIFQDSHASRQLVRRWLIDYKSWLLAATLTLGLALGCVPVSYTNNTGAQESYAGQWLIEFRTGEPVIQLTLRYRSRRDGHDFNNNTSFEIRPEQLQGLTREQAMSGGTHVQFQFKRDAGTFNCEGWFRDGDGSGHYTFSPSPAFNAELKNRGYGVPTAEQQFSMAMHDVGLSLIEELRAQGYERPPLDQLIRMGMHGVGLDYVRGLKSLGYTLRTVGALIEMRDHGVSLGFVRELTALGYTQLPAEALVRAKDHGVSTEFIKELKALGYERLTLNQLIRMKDHGVSIGFVKGLAALGYTQLSVDELVAMRDHGVSLEFVKELKQLGYERATPDQLILLRDHGVTAAFIQRMKARGLGNLSIEELVRLRDHGGDGE